MPNGQVFLETHHIIPLSEGGGDVITNVAALCPNHHREAHHGSQAELIRAHLLEVAALPSRKK
jgi:predicted HNH restriction endonuclease